MTDKPFRPIFIGGAGRSGTTLLRAMLASHPQLAGTSEFKFLPNLAELWRNLSAYDEVTSAYQLSQAHINASFAQFARSLFQPYLASVGDRRLVEKTPHNVLAIDFLSQVFADARHIHIIRDGRDVIGSLRQMEWYGPDGKRLWYTESVEGAANYWCQVVRGAMQQASQLPDKSLCRRVRYESLVAEPESVMRKILEWLGEDWDDAVLSDEQRQAMAVAEVVESSSEQVSRSINRDSVGRWRKAFTAAERQVIHTIAGELLIELGYTKNDGWVE